MQMLILDRCYLQSSVCKYGGEFPSNKHFFIIQYHNPMTIINALKTMIASLNFKTFKSIEMSQAFRATAPSSMISLASDTINIDGTK